MVNKNLKCCFALALCGIAAHAAPLGGGESNTGDRLRSMPMLTLAEAASMAGLSTVAVLDAGGARLAGLVLSLPSLEGEAWKVIADLPQDMLKVLDRVEAPLPVAAVNSVTVGYWDVPNLTILAYACAALLLAAGGVFGGALLKLSMDEARKNKRMRRRYAP